MSKPQDEQAFRVKRSLSLIVIFTLGSLYAIDRDLLPPHGQPLLYAIALSWLIALAVAITTSAIFVRADPTLFSLAPWEQEGAIYDRTGIRAFRGSCFIRRWAGSTRTFT